MNNFYNINMSEIVQDIKDISDKVDEELSKEEVDREKVNELIYQQFVKGLYLTQNPLMQNNY